MPIAFSPKSNYQGFHADCAEELARHADKRWFTVSIAYALAQMTDHASSEQIDGARRFIQTLVNLPEKTEAAKEFPKRELTVLEQT